MNRIVNNPDFVVEDMLKGFVKTQRHRVYNRRCKGIKI